MAGALKSKEGEVILHSSTGNQYTPVDLSEHFGYIDQHFSLFDDTIRNNITLWRNINDAEEKKISQLLSEFNVSVDLTRNVSSLS